MFEKVHVCPRRSSRAALLLLTTSVVFVAALTVTSVGSGATKPTKPKAPTHRPAPTPPSFEQGHSIRPTVGPTTHRRALSPNAMTPTAALAANTYTVDSTDDTHRDVAAPAGVCADVWGNCTLRAAIETADTISGGSSQINVPAGVYVLTLGELAASADMTIQGAGAGSTVVVQFGARVLHVTASSAEIAGMTLQNGSAAYGAGIYVEGAALTLSSVVVKNNEAGTYGDGGGVYSDYNSSLWLIDSVLEGNAADSGEGGGLFNGGAAYLRNSTIGGSAGHGNSAQYGGGVLNYGNLVADNVTIQGNTATYQGGGVYADETTTLNGGAVTGNTADGGTVRDGYGGGISNYRSMSMTGTTVSNNVARGSHAYGGGVYNDATMQLTDVTVSGNAVYNTVNGNDVRGGGVANDYTLEMSGGSIGDNTATLDPATAGLTSSLVHGGGLYNDETASLDGVTIAGNEATAGTGFVEGGGVASFYSLTLENSSVDGNTAAGKYVYGAGAYTDGSAFVDNVDVSHNTADATDYAVGAGMDNESYAHLRSVRLDGNVARATAGSGWVEGGALFLGEESNLADVSVTNTVAEAVDAGYVEGGGVYIYYPATITGSSFVGTSAVAGAEIRGAGLFVDDVTSLTNSVIADNHGEVTGASGVAEGGGLFQYYDANYVNVTVAGNSVTASNGGVANYGGAYIDDNTQMTNATWANNHADTDVGGFYADSYYTVTVKNSIVSGNTSAGVGNCSADVTARIISAGWNLESQNTCGFTNQGDRYDVDPLLGPLQDNGGNTLTMAPALASPALDAATANGAPPTDQRGIARPQGAAPDIGAFELAAPTGVDDTYSAVEKKTLTVAAPGVLANDAADRSLPASVLTAQLVSTTAHGTLTLNSDGSFVYKPVNRDKFTGADTFTYRAYDGHLYSKTVTVTINVVSARA